MAGQQDRSTGGTVQPLMVTSSPELPSHLQHIPGHRATAWAGHEAAGGSSVPSLLQG